MSGAHDTEDDDGLQDSETHAHTHAVVLDARSDRRERVQRPRVEAELARRR